MSCMHRWGWLGVVLLTAAGCGSGKYAVEGQVVWPDGTPAKELAGYSVEFNSPEMKVSAVGVVRPDGTFELYTDKPGDGVLPGTYKVAVTRPDPEGDVRPPPLLVPRKYTDSETSGLVEMVEGRKKVILKVERARR